MIGQDRGAARRILAVRLDGMGDSLMTGPALRVLKDAVPGRAVTAPVSPAVAACAAFLPEIDDFIVHETSWMKGSKADVEADHALIGHLRTQDFDGTVIFTVFSQSLLPAALLCHLAAIPRRAAHCGENPYAQLTTWIPEREPQAGIRHKVERQSALAGHLGAADVVVTYHTGPAHLAAAATAVVVLYALTKPQHGPWRATARSLSVVVLCRNCFKSVCAICHHRCLEDVRPWRVVNAVTELLQEGADARRRASC
jgi:ADP-heptose:LPS heptosyltransferase